VSRGRKEQRHACSVIGTQQYRRMESNSANAPSANGSTGVEAAGKTGERETNAPNLFEAPQAAEERETNAPCQGETAKNTGTRETNVLEKDTAAARIDGRPPVIAEQQRRVSVGGPKVCCVGKMQYAEIICTNPVLFPILHIQTIGFSGMALF
jgi:hypothetical protein